MRKLKLIEPVVDEEEIRNVAKVLRSGWLTEGQLTKQLEETIRNYVGTEYAIAITSCTAALELSLRALGIGHGDEVIVPDFTHPATGHVVKWIGAEPVLVDVDLLSYNIDPVEVEKAITEKTKCIIPISWGGNPLNMDPFNELKEKYGLFIVEDAACSLGAEFNGRKTGTMADITCFSFHPRKLVTTGEGGMVVTDNVVYAERIKSLKNFGIEMKDGKSRFTRWGTNYKLSDILSAVGVAQVRKIDRIINKRIQLANYYDKLLADEKLVRPPEKSKNAKHIYQTYAVYIEKEGARDKIMKDLMKKDIETQIGTYALHVQPIYERVRKIGRLERAEKLYRNLLALPMSHSMVKEDQELVISEMEKSIYTR